jgi:uncharacterized delta-60 repeat protein
VTARHWVAPLLLAFHATLALAEPGQLDGNYATSGYDHLALPTNCSEPGVGTCRMKASAIALQPDGRVVIAADVDYDTSPQPGIPSLNRLTLMRRLANGGPDPSFGTNGVAQPFPTPGQFSYAGPIALQSDGKVLAGMELAYMPREYYVLRLNADGTIDTGFGDNGLAAVGGPVQGVATQSDGAVVFATRVTGGLGTRVVLGRLLSNGTPDASFEGGVAGTDLGIPDPAYIPNNDLPFTATYAVALVLQADDRPMVAATSGSRIVIVRRTRDGAADATFDGDGRLELEDGTALALDTSVGNGVLALQSTGRILVSGSSGQAALVFAFTPAGAPDAAFGLGGRKPLSPMPGAPVVPAAIAVQPDDRIVAVGYYLVERLTPDGWRDATFLQSVSPTFNRLRVAAQGERILTLAPGYPGWPGLSIRGQQAGDSLDIFGGGRGPTNFVMAQYRDFLDREGDDAGRDFWVSGLGTRHTRGQVIESFLASDEFQGTIAPVARLYFAYFLRVPDFSGLHFWTTFHRGGASLDEISGYFAQSGEFQSTYGSLDNGQFVNLVYQNVLARAPDPGGYAFWKGQLDSGAMTRGQVMAGFSESEEHRSLSFSEVFVTMAYTGMLQRNVDAPGFSFWVGYLDAGNPPLALIDGILLSQEYHDRFLPQ